MNLANNGYGIKSFAYHFGEKKDVLSTAASYVQDPERILSWGCKHYYRAANQEFAVDMASLASEKALNDARLRSNDIDLIVYASSEMPEYLYWDSSSALAKQLNIDRVETMLLNNEGSGSGIKAFGHIAGALAVNPNINNILFAAVNRVSEHHRNRMNVNNCVHSDGAVAVVLQRGHQDVQWMATRHFTCPEYNDFFRSDYGGAKLPVRPESVPVFDDAGYSKLHQHFGSDLKRMRHFIYSERNDKIVEVIRMACVMANVELEDIKHLIYLNDARPGAIFAIAERLNIPTSNTNYKYAVELGHMGAADQIISLGKHIEDSDLKKGDLVVLCGISTGMQWCASIFKI